MRWTPGGPSADLEDDRGSTGGGGGGFGGRHIGIGGFIVLLLLSLVFHRNFFALLGGGGAPASAPAGQTAPVNSSPEEDKEVQFVSFVLDDVQKTWEQVFAQNNQQYRHAKLVLFRDQVRSGCGNAETAMGPFYCPADEKVYIDLGFYKELKSRFGASGDFAEAYVIAHELGHHVQNLLGISGKVERAQRQDSGQANALSVRLELPGRLPGGRLGALHPAAQHPRSRRCGRGAQRGFRGGRRPDSASGHRTRESRDLDPRLRPAALAMVQDGFRVRLHSEL